MAAKRRIWTPLRIFFATVCLLIAIAVLWDAFHRESVDVSGVRAPRTQEELGISELKVRFDSLSPNTEDPRPSTLEKLEQRSELAALMVRKSTAEELPANLLLQLQALRDCYRVYRRNQLDSGKWNQELRSVIERVERDGSGELLENALLLHFQLDCDRLIDGGEPAEIIPSIDQSLRRLAASMTDPLSANELEKSLLTMSTRPGAGAETVQLLECVSGIFAGHQVPVLAKWGSKLGDDAIFLRHGVFEVYEQIRSEQPDAAASFLSILPELLAEHLSDHGLQRLAAVSEAISLRTSAATARQCYQLILERARAREASELARGCIRSCENAIARIDRLGQRLDLSVTDVDGRTLRIGEDTNLADTGLVICAVDRVDDFSRIFGPFIERQQQSMRNMRLVVLALGQDEASARSAYGDWLGPNVLVVADRNSDGPLAKACPPENLPWIWIVSRDHRLIDFGVPLERLATAVENMNFSR